ncbi:hypothetical protein SDC9_116946 [bioreactor metagenome]|uniref:Uncharacterized protein n=1 Tax=bioreactor metagenome TaxID=1076179 RepID=A0A645BY16_9ZZZZ
MDIIDTVGTDGSCRNGGPVTITRSVFPTIYDFTGIPPGIGSHTAESKSVFQVFILRESQHITSPTPSVRAWIGRIWLKIAPECIAKKYSVSTRLHLPDNPQISSSHIPFQCIIGTRKGFSSHRGSGNTCYPAYCTDKKTPPVVYIKRNFLGNVSIQINGLQ